MTLDAILPRAVRVAAGWRCAPPSALPPDVAARLARGRVASAVLFPGAASPLPPKLVAPDVACVVRALRRARPASAVACAELGVGAASLAALVLDGVVEMEADGVWVTGAAAAAALGVTPPPHARTLVGRRSRDALRHAHAFARGTPARVARALYAYGRLPLAPRWRAAPARDDVAHWVASGASWPGAGGLPAGWHGPTGRGAWLHWSGPNPAPPRAARTWKLYVSPAYDAAEEVLRLAARVLAASAACAFKVAAPPHGLLRPDKIVAYFASPGELRRTADELLGELSGAPVHGVPFTAPLAGDGLLSWGIDPPPAAPFAATSGARSWRAWVTARLASFLVVGAATATPALTAEDFALLRLEWAHGVDTASWAPPHTLWAAP